MDRVEAVARKRARALPPAERPPAALRGLELARRMLACDFCGERPATEIDAHLSIDVCARCDTVACARCQDAEPFVVACDNDACPTHERALCPLCDATCDECATMFCDLCLRDWAEDAARDQYCACVRACLGVDAT